MSSTTDRACLLRFPLCKYVVFFCMFLFQSLIFIYSYKPIFCCAATFLRWGLALVKTPTPEFCVGDTNMLVSKNTKICVTPDANPQRQSVEYRLRWVLNANFSRWPCTFHFLVLISIALGIQREPLFQWNMDLTVY